MEGKLKMANSRGFGFIESNGIDFFFHHTQFQGDWKELLKKFVTEQIVRLEYDNDSEAPAGPRALNVRVKEIKES